MPVALLVIDDQSMHALGRWPWSRGRFAEIVRRLSDAGARGIAFDILCTEPEEQPVRQAVQALRSRFETLDLSEHHAGLRALHHTLVRWPKPRPLTTSSLRRYAPHGIRFWPLPWRQGQRGSPLSPRPRCRPLLPMRV